MTHLECLNGESLAICQAFSFLASNVTPVKLRLS